MGQQTSTTFRLSDVDPGEARMAGLGGGTPSALDITYGKDDHGAEFKLFGATSGCFMLWDESADTLKVTTTSAVTTGAFRSVEISQTMTGTSTSNTPEALRVQIIANVKTGTWANVIFAQLDYSTDGLAHGIGSVICAELSLPASSVVRGTYVVHQIEIDCPTSCVMNGNPIEVFRLNSWGAAKAQFDDYGYLFSLVGISSGAAHLWYDHQGGAPANVEEWIRVRTPGGVRYLALYNAVV